MTRVLCLTILILLVGCATHEPLPAALPEERVVFEPPPDVADVVPLQEIAIPTSAVPLIQPTPAELAVPKKPTSRATAPPEKVIREANRQSLVPPSTAGYRDNRSVYQRYPYVAGQMYEVYSAPNHPTTLVFPPGEYLAQTPDIDTENESAWVVSLAEMGEGLTYQQVVKIRPLRAGLEYTTSFVFQSGLILPCRLRSFATTSMVVVTWDMPRRPLPLAGAPRPRAPGFQAKRQAETPLIDPARMHTAYTITATKGSPPWVPLAVYDDGTKSIIRFRESLHHTQAPAPFAIDSEGKINLVQFIPYSVPGEPEKGTYYILTGLYPRIELKVGESQVVTITRQTGEPKPYQAEKP